MNKKLTVGLKYCGGCNPSYDRAALVDELKAAYPQVEFCPYRQGEVYDLALLVKGCRRPCGDFDSMTARYGTLSIADKGDVAHFHRRMEEVLRQQKESTV